MNDDPLAPNNSDDFEKFIGLLCQQSGYEVIMPPANTKGYDIELKKDTQRIAVQVKNHNRRF